MPKFDVKIELHGKFFFYKDVEAETMDDACTKAKTRAQRSLKVASVAPSPAVRPDPKQSNVKEMDGKSIFEQIFGPPYSR